MQAKKLILTASAVLALQACSSDTDYDFQSGIDNQQARAAAEAAPQAIFDPAESIIPFPNSLLFAGSGDGTLNIPVEDATDLSNPQVALNQLDGFSTTSPIATGFTADVDPGTLIVGSTIRILEFTSDPDGSNIAVTGEVPPQAMVATQTGGQLVLLPLVPLNEKSNYLVMLTNGVIGANGEPLAASVAYRLAKSRFSLVGGQAEALEPVRVQTDAQLNAAAEFDASLAREGVVLSWAFRTQAIRDVLQSVFSQVASAPLTVAPTGFTTVDVQPAVQIGKADVLIGTLDVPYYQTAATPGDPASAVAALNSFWVGQGDLPVSQFNPQPTLSSTQTIPVLMTVPNAQSTVGATAPADGWPIAIFQHGITRNRFDMIPLANAMADAGFAMIAIDIPLHGLTDTALPFHTDNTAFPNDQERTFGIDVINNTTMEAGGDEVPDNSGQHFYNLANLANSRDNLRQAVADLMVLSASLPNLAGVPLNTARKAFIGHSLGGIVGTTLLSYDDTFASGSLAMPGGGIAQLLANSESFGPAIVGGLANAGVEVGTPEFSQFLTAAQSVVDSADPINNASALAGTGTPIHLIEVRGDAVIPNAVATAPLSGTTPLARQIGLMTITGTTNTGGHVIFNAANATHGSILDPGTTAESLAVTTEMQTQVAAFAASAGTVLPIGNPALIEGGMSGANP